MLTNTSLFFTQIQLIIKMQDAVEVIALRRLIKYVSLYCSIDFLSKARSVSKVLHICLSHLLHVLHNLGLH